MKASAKIRPCALAAVLFPLLLICIYILHSRYFPVDVILYSALFDVAIATAIFSVLLLFSKTFAPLGALEKLQMIVIACLFGALLALLFPTIIDRSLSFYLLEKLQQRGGGIRLDRIEEVIAREYLQEHRLVSVRLTEQLESGTIQIHDGCVVLTARGRNLATFSRLFRTTVLPRQRLLMGEYTDALTDPFRAGTPAADYGCK